MFYYAVIIGTNDLILILFALLLCEQEYFQRILCKLVKFRVCISNILPRGGVSQIFISPSFYFLSKTDNFWCTYSSSISTVNTIMQRDPLCFLREWAKNSGGKIAGPLSVREVPGNAGRVGGGGRQGKFYPYKNRGGWTKRFGVVLYGSLKF